MSNPCENTTVHAADFPFEEIRSPSGDYWDDIEDVLNAGYTLDQVWSVCEADNVFCYGPANHRVNLLGYVATNERHDGNTYYEESLDDEFLD